MLTKREAILKQSRNETLLHTQNWQQFHFMSTKIMSDLGNIKSLFQFSQRGDETQEEFMHDGENQLVRKAHKYRGDISSSHRQHSFVANQTKYHTNHPKFTVFAMDESHHDKDSIKNTPFEQQSEINEGFEVSFGSEECELSDKTTNENRLTTDLCEQGDVLHGDQNRVAKDLCEPQRESKHQPKHHRHEEQSEGSVPEKMMQRHCRWFGHGKMLTVSALIFSWMALVLTLMARQSVDFVRFQETLVIAPIYSPLESIGKQASTTKRYHARKRKREET